MIIGKLWKMTRIRQDGTGMISFGLAQKKAGLLACSFSQLIFCNTCKSVSSPLTTFSRRTFSAYLAKSFCIS